jgi:putative toxin-antitoxin system antitoxin component (TIGR02293 family)
VNAVAAVPETNIFMRIGSWLGTRLTTDLDAMALTQRGISVTQFRRAAGRFSLPMDLPAPESTVRRREKNREAFTPAESERVLRVLRVLAEAIEFFGDDAKALAWMRRPAEFVPGQPATAPMTMATSEIGARHIEGLIRRSEHGMF